MIDRDKLRVGMRVYYIDRRSPKRAIASDIITGVYYDGYKVSVSGQTIRQYMGHTDESYTVGGLYMDEMYATLSDAVVSAYSEVEEEIRVLKWNIEILRHNLKEMTELGAMHAEVGEAIFELLEGGAK